MNELKNGMRQHGVTSAEMFTYILIVIVLAAVAFGKYINSSLENAVSEALALGEAQKAAVEEYFAAHGKMPQSGAEAGLEGFTPAGVLKELTWQPGAFGEADADPLMTGTLNGKVTLAEFGKRFEEIESAYRLIARAQEDGTITWDCLPDKTKAGLPSRYLPESCERAGEADE